MKNLSKKIMHLSCVLGWLVIVTGVMGCRAETPVWQTVKEPAVAGAFYPADPKELKAWIDEALKAAPHIKIQSPVKALLVPHAGYIYSGKITAVGMALLTGQKVDTVYVVGTSHYSGAAGALIWAGKALRTPLGDYPVDVEAVKELLAQCPEIKTEPLAWAREHSVEVQIPFLQRVAPDAKVVPLVMGRATPEQVQAIGAALSRQAAQRQAVFIASTDLSHFPNAADAERVDAAMVQSVLSLDPEQVRQSDRVWMTRGIAQLECTVCGLEALETVMVAAKANGADQSRLLQYLHSGKVSGDSGRVVGYAAVTFYEKVKPQTAVSAIAEDRETLSPEQRQALLTLARNAIAHELRLEPSGQVDTTPAWMQIKRGVFVTLRQQHELRGCIGMTEPYLPISEAIQRMACAAAFEDTRFSPLTANEFNRTSIEISLLSPLQKIKKTEDIIMGRHGVVVRSGSRTGLFLPQVAQETGWTRENFLDELCAQKAHLPARAWQDPATELYVFTVQAFEQSAP